ncbi:hypothetical protein HG537_0D05210 [Torulaspora globosa]|uniref:BAG domain-containing protein n=1 Tax=Torulaspora globosa TaxID=48254 RepID=A0A7H9HT66_9SACH|nr:hypothetical protein HG537_0D05210 [Torulaspora sp. CBS 2947]
MDRFTGFYNANLKPYISDHSEIYLTGAATIIVTAILWRNHRLKASKKSQQPRKKSLRTSSKKPIAMTPKKRIDNVHLRFIEEYKQDLLKLLENYNPSDNDHVYQRNYYNEMLLKLLIELDSVDLSQMTGDERLTLKQYRKTVIKEIQTHLKLLDKLA